jgi:hypothetical protein
MEAKHQVHNLIILDESGSMGFIKKPIMSAFNELVQTIKAVEKQFPEQEHFISFVTFNGTTGHTELHHADPVKKIKVLNTKSYMPNGSTPLFDSMGFSILKLKALLEKVPNHNVLVTILTDGEENASREFRGQDIKKLVDDLKTKNWTFTYIGTDHDIKSFANSISVENTLYFDKSEVGVGVMMNRERAARLSFSRKIRDNESTVAGFYGDEPYLEEEKPKSEPKTKPGFWERLFS